jgi:hypothetical protein
MNNVLWPVTLTPPLLHHNDQLDSGQACDRRRDEKDVRRSIKKLKFTKGRFGNVSL